MSDFNLAILRVLENEGGLSDDSGDSGGLTNYGISSKSYPNVDIRQLTKEQAEEIYKRDYWDANRLGEVQVQEVAGKLLDMAVNMGSYRMTIILQQCLANDYRMQLGIDGIIGGKTINCTNQAGVTLIDHLRTRSVKFYEDLAEEHTQDRKFLDDWLARARQ